MRERERERERERLASKVDLLKCMTGCKLDQSWYCETF